MRESVRGRLCFLLQDNPKIQSQIDPSYLIPAAYALSKMILKYTEYSSARDITKKYDRKGKCDFRKCKGACCRFSLIGSFSLEPYMQYIKNMGYRIETIDGKRYGILEKPCRQLDLKTYKCRIYQRRPIPCRQFPVPSDLVYKRVRKACSFFFEGKGEELTMGQ